MEDATPVPECWLPVVGYEGLYEVSDLGNVRSLPRKGGNNRTYGGGRLNPHADNVGYLALGLSRDARQVAKRVHQLVAEAFIGPCPPGQEVRHGPGGPLDNSAANLSYGTRAQNMADMIRDGHNRPGSKMHNAKLNEADVVEIRQRYASGKESYATLARDYGVDWSAIRFVVKGKTWKHVA